MQTGVGRTGNAHLLAWLLIWCGPGLSLHRGRCQILAPDARSYRPAKATMLDSPSAPGLLPRTQCFFQVRHRRDNRNLRSRVLDATPAAVALAMILTAEQLEELEAKMLSQGAA